MVSWKEEGGGYHMHMFGEFFGIFKVEVISDVGLHWVSMHAATALHSYSLFHARELYHICMSSSIYILVDVPAYGRHLY